MTLFFFFLTYTVDFIPPPSLLAASPRYEETRWTVFHRMIDGWMRTFYPIKSIWMFVCLVFFDIYKILRGGTHDSVKAT